MFRLLEIGEVTRLGDEYYSHLKWRLMLDGQIIGKEHWPIRRKTNLEDTEKCEKIIEKCKDRIQELKEEIYFMEE